MAVITGQDQDHPRSHSSNLIPLLDEIMAAYRKLPPRPSVDEVDAARSLVETVDSEEKARMEEINRQKTPGDVPEELFSVLRDVRRIAVRFRSFQQRKDAVSLIETEETFEKFDRLIQRDSKIVGGGDTCVPRKVVRSSSIDAAGEESVNYRKLSLMEVAGVIENSARTGAETLDLRGKMKDEIECLPVSIGKLSAITELDISENRISALPSAIGDLRALTRLRAHSNHLSSLPESFGDLTNIQDLDFHANHLISLPASFGNLSQLLNLDLSSNELVRLPDIIGNFSALRKLNVETNGLEELPYTIGSCTSLVELRLDFNHLKGLPEAIGKLESLEILTLHYNRVKGLPTTTGNLSNLRELDVSFNELESIPENLPFAVSLEKLNLGKNFTDLRSLPRSIGNLEMLEELDISDNQIRTLPDSFRFLSRLRILRADETPLELPPRETAKLGAQAVVQYMADHVAKREAKSLASKKTKKTKRGGYWLPWLCSMA